MDSIDRTAEPVELRKLIFSVLDVQEFSDESDAYEYVEKVESRVKDFISESISRRNVEGKVCSFCFSPSDTPFLQGIDFINHDDDDDVKAAKLARHNLDAIQNTVRSLSPSGFESLMRSILTGLGVSDVYITPSRSDDGIDFVGRLNVGVISNHVLLEDNFSNEIDLFIVGQAKRYVASKFKLADLRELVGSVVLLKSNVTARVNDIEWPFRVRVSDPVLNLFAISNEVSRSGWKLSSDSGVKVLDIEKLALLIADLGIDLAEIDAVTECKGPAI